jgi:lipopolysaccharide export system permease protein
MDLLVNRGVPWHLFLQFVGTLFPPLVILTAPMAVLVGVLLGVGRLAADNEIMAMRTSGVHLMTVFAPVLLAACILAGGLWYANGSWVPRLFTFNTFLLGKIKYIVANSLEAGRVFKPESDMDAALYFRHRNPLTQRMESITLKVIAVNQERPQSKTEVVATAREGRLDSNPDTGAMDIVLTSGTLHHFDTVTTASELRHYLAQFQELRWRLEHTPKAKIRAGRLLKKARELSSPEIARALELGQLDRTDQGSLVAEVQQRRSIPLACVAFAVLGVPLAIRVRPRGKAVAFSIAFGLIFFYYIMLKWGVSICQTSTMLGAFIIYLPNIIVGGVGAVLFYRTLRQ